MGCTDFFLEDDIDYNKKLQNWEGINSEISKGCVDGVD